MDFITEMRDRHSVRSYIDRPIESEICQKINSVIEECNRQGGLNIRLVVNEPKAFGGFMGRYGKFSGVKNYVALIAEKGKDEKIGYYGEKIVLSAQALGLNTCWVALTYKKIDSALNIGKNEKLYCVIAIGYGATQGVEHKSKTADKVSVGYDSAPEWFKNGVKAALLAPTAINQQKFVFSYENGAVSAKAGVGFYCAIDLGIAKYHFELGSGKKEIGWI